MAKMMLNVLIITVWKQFDTYWLGNKLPRVGGGGWLDKLRLRPTQAQLGLGPELGNNMYR